MQYMYDQQKNQTTIIFEVEVQLYKFTIKKHIGNINIHASVKDMNIRNYRSMSTTFTEFDFEQNVIFNILSANACN